MQPPDDLVGAFCAWHHSYNNISSERSDAQCKLLRRLEVSLGGRPIASLQSQDLETFLAACNVAPATTLKHLKMIRPFLKWMWKNGHINGDQLMLLRGVQAPRGAAWAPPKPYTRRELGVFWREFERAFPWTRDSDLFDRTPKRGEYWVRRWQETPDSWEWHQMRPYARRLQAEAIVALALFGGLRRVEIFQLELEDMHYENAYVRVRGARKNPAAIVRERPVSMAEPMRVALSNWVEFRAQVLQPPHDRPWLALWTDLGPMCLSALAHMLDRVGDGYELHRLRHTFATERLRADMPIEKLQVALGHSNIAMTLRYSEIGDEDVLKAAEQTNDEFVAAVSRRA